MNSSVVASGAASADGKTLQFTVPSTLAPTCTSNMACPQYIIGVIGADYQITVINSNGTSNAQTFSVGKLLCPEVMCAAPPVGFSYVPTPGVCGCGTLIPNTY